MATKTSPREKMLSFVCEQGWTLDPTARMSKSAYGRGVVPDRYTFLKNAAHGGQWRVHFNYRVKSGYVGNIGESLQNVDLTYIAPDAPLTEREYGFGENAETIAVPEFTHPFGPQNNKYWTSLTMMRPRRYSSTSWLYEAAYSEAEGDAGNTLAARARRLVQNPDLVVWLAGEMSYTDSEREKARRAEKSLDRELRARPLPVTVSQNGYGSEWQKLTGKAVSAAQAVQKADGKSDLHALMAELEQAVAAVKAVTKVEVDA